MTPEAATQRLEIRIHNSSSEKALVLEPWGDIVKLAPDTTYTATAEGPLGDTFEVEIVDERVIKLWAPDNSSLEILAKDGSSPEAFDIDSWREWEARTLTRVGDTKASYTADSSD